MTELLATASDSDALREEIDLVREDMAESIHRLQDALSLRRAVRARPSVAAALVAVGGALLLLAIRRGMNKRRARRAHQSVRWRRG